MQTNFVGLSAEDVAYLQMNDPAVADIAELTIANRTLTFDWFRTRFKDQNGTKDSLQKGHTIIKNHDQMNQYLYTYGPMISSQWSIASEMINFSKGHYRLLDYGCGQGLAGLLLHDHFGTSLFENVAEIMLIEPSCHALTRAEAVYRSIAPASSIKCICKSFDEIAQGDLGIDSSLENIHILSNVLDVPSYDHFGLFSKMLEIGHHIVIAVSHDRDFDGGSSRIFDIKNAIDAHGENGNAHVTFSDVQRYKCTNGNQSDAILWRLQLEVTS